MRLALEELTADVPQRRRRLEPVPAADNGPAAQILELQRTVGNRAVTQLLSRKRDRPEPKPLADMNRLRALATAAKGRRDMLANYLKTARDDLGRYRAKFRLINERYEAAYKKYKETIKSVNASIDSEQFVVNQVFSLVNNVTVGALGNALQSAKVISAGVNLYAGSAINTATGNLAPQIPKAEVSDDVNPALRRADGLQKLDDLNATVLGIAADAIVPVSEPMQLAEKLMAEVRVATARGKRELTDDEVRKGVADLEGYEKRGDKFMVAVLTAHQGLDKLRLLCKSLALAQPASLRAGHLDHVDVAPGRRLGPVALGQRARPPGAAYTLDRARPGHLRHRLRTGPARAHEGRQAGSRDAGLHGPCPPGRPDHEQGLAELAA